MADLTLLANIYWDIRFAPTSLLTKNWDKVVLPSNDFTIEYKVAIPDPEAGDDAYKLINRPIKYETDGQSVTVGDLLLTMYLFYQEKLDKTDPFYQDNRGKSRLDIIGDETFLQSLIQVSPDIYKLRIAFDPKQQNSYDPEQEDLFQNYDAETDNEADDDSDEEEDEDIF